MNLVTQRPPARMATVSFHNTSGHVRDIADILDQLYKGSYCATYYAAVGLH